MPSRYDEVRVEGVPLTGKREVLVYQKGREDQRYHDLKEFKKLLQELSESMEKGHQKGMSAFEIQVDKNLEEARRTVREFFGMVP